VNKEFYPVIFRSRAIVAARHLWYKARAIEAINFTHVPIPAAGCFPPSEMKEEGC